MTTGTGTQRAREAGRGVPTDVRPRRGVLDVVLPALLLMCLVLLTVEVVRGGAVVRVDELVRARTPGQGNGPVVPGLIGLAVVDLATPPLWAGAVLVLGAVLSVRTSRWAPLVLTGAATGLLSATVLLAKDLIVRPASGTLGVLSAGGAYPSGHTATALICAGVVAELVSQARPARRRTAWLLAAGWTLLVAAALVWLHFHWLSDVVASILLGSLLLWLLLRWPLRLGDAVLGISGRSRRCRRRRSRSG